MSTTPVLNLEKISPATLACDGLIDAFNGNMDKLDEMPLPTASGSNSQLSYQKYSDGVLHVFGCIDVGTAYPCQNGIGRDFQSSKRLDVSFPTAFIDATYSLQLTTHADKWPDVTFACNSKTTGGFTGYFVLPMNDSAQSNSKKLSVDCWGRWK